MKFSKLRTHLFTGCGAPPPADFHSGDLRRKDSSKIRIPGVMSSNGVMNPNGYWTDEKHVQFLNSMEASFVRAMFETNRHPLPRLDRHIPDTSDSTLDLKTRTTRRIPTPVGSKGRNDKKASRSLSSQPYDISSEDQVVPQPESRGSDKAEGDHSSVPIYTANSERC